MVAATARAHAGPSSRLAMPALGAPDGAVGRFAVDAVCTLHVLNARHRAAHDTPLLTEADGYRIIFDYLDALELARGHGLSLGALGPANCIVDRQGALHWFGWGDLWRGPAAEEAALGLIRPPGAQPGVSYDLIADLRLGFVAIASSPTYMQVPPRVRDVLAGRPDPGPGDLLSAYDSLMRGLYGQPSERFTAVAQARAVFAKVVDILAIDTDPAASRARIRQHLEVLGDLDDASPSPSQAVIAWHDTVVDLGLRVIRRGADTHALTAREAELIAYLAAHADRIVSQRELLTEVWGYAPSVRSRAVADLLKRLRPKIETHPTRPERLVTAHGNGIRLILP